MKLENMKDLKSFANRLEGANPSEAIQKLIQSKIKISGECHLWTGPKSMKGYPRLAIDAVVILAHKAAYLLANPTAELKDKHVHHKCRTKACVNVEHLEVVTIKEHNKIHSIWFDPSKITDLESQVLALYSAGLSGVDITEELRKRNIRVSKSTIYRMLQKNKVTRQHGGSKPGHKKRNPNLVYSYSKPN